MKEVEEGNLFLEGDSFCGECDEDDDISINDIYIYIYKIESERHHR